MNVKVSKKQRVWPAAKIFLNLVAKAIKYCCEQKLTPTHTSCIGTLQLFNDWFDALNSKSKHALNTPGKNGFCVDLEHQKSIIIQLSNFIISARVRKYNSLHVKKEYLETNLCWQCLNI